MQQVADIVEITSTNKIEVTYPITDTAIEILRKEFLPLVITDSNSYKAVTAAIREVRKYRVLVEKKRKELKKDVLVYGRRIDGEAKRIVALLEPIEEELKAKKKVVDDVKAAEAARIAKVEADRISGIRKRIFDIQGVAIGLNDLDVKSLENLLMQIEDEELLIDEYGEFANEAKQALAETMNAIIQANDVRIRLDKEEAARKAEDERLKDEARKMAIRAKIQSLHEVYVTPSMPSSEIATLVEDYKKNNLPGADFQEFQDEASRVYQKAISILCKMHGEKVAWEEAAAKIAERQKAERKRLDAENARLEAIRRLEAERLAEEQAHIDAENRKIEEAKAVIAAEKQAEIDRKEREALEKKLAAEAKVKAEQEANEKAEREKAERIARKEAELKEIARQEALKPDKEKLENWARGLLDMTAASVMADDAISIAEGALDKVYEVAEWVLEKTSKL